MSFVSTSTEFAMIDTRSNSGALVLPFTTEIPGRIINIKDTYGTFTNSTLTVYTQGGEAFEDGTNFKVLNAAYDSLQVYTASTSRWYITAGTEQNITSQNIAVVSTLQTFNWPSLCNHVNLGYGSTFNPAAVGRISLLDNIFTSSTAGLASTFIEFGNLNAQPRNMTPGNAFRWLVGVEPSQHQTSGLDFKIKRWISFSNANSNFYGANSSTIQDVTIWDPAGAPGNPPTLIHTGPFVISTLGNAYGPTPSMMRFLNAGGASYIQFASSMNAGAGGTLQFGGINNNPGPGMTLQGGALAGTAFNSGTLTIYRPGYVIGGESAAQSTNALVIYCGQRNGSGDGGAIAFDHSFTGGFGGTQSGRGSRIASICDSGSFGQSIALTFATGQNQIQERMRISAIGNVGIGCNAPSFTLDTNGPARTGMPVSSITGVIANVGLTGFGVYYYIRNSGFCNLVLPTTDPFSGWFVTLRNNSGTTLSVTITGTNSKIPASPFSIAPANSVSLAYDASPPAGGCNWVYF